MIKPKISKQKPIWSPKLEKEFQQELKNSSKISVIKERLNKNIGKVVFVTTTTDKLRINFKGKLTTDDSNKFFEVESKNKDFIDFTLKHIERISNTNFIARIYLKLK